MATKIHGKEKSTSSKELKRIDLMSFRLKRSLSNPLKIIQGKMLKEEIKPYRVRRSLFFVIVAIVLAIFMIALVKEQQ